MTPNPTPSDPNQTLDIYDPTNPNFVNPNDVLQQHPNDTAAAVASTRTDVIVATAKRQVEAQIVTLNNNLKLIYTNAFAPWLYGWQNGRMTDKSTAPVPPMAYVVGWTLVASVQWPYPMQGTVPVCAMPTIPDIAVAAYEPNAMPLGQLGTKTNASAVDGFPVGYQATREDGSVWQKCTARTPFGTAWWWECVKAVS
jgi:hypothetical protein